jgi:malate dehydrogenase (oxaloacetate-decarboxylating)(NADP+)
MLDECEDLDIDFEYDGEMTPSMALDFAMLQQKYPFTTLTAEPNILIMPNADFGNIIVDTIKSIDKSATIIGSILLGMEKSVQICNHESTANDLFNLAVVATINN